ncbi:MAG: DUF5615 family PIN-like protein [Saprospiraceae bacterium]
MRILADENIDYPIVQGLRTLGFDVDTILEQNQGIPDEAVLEKSNIEKSILLTEDKDFGEHVFRIGSKFSGVILVRLPWNDGIDERLKAIASCLELHQEKLIDAFIVISPGRVRIRKR